MGIDIIIPIYNAYDDLCKCLQSVYQYTDLVTNRLILINDNSSDTRIEPYLNSQTKENVIIIHNKENKGFSNNINLGMAQSKERDVLLLNSDTIVTKNWVEKIVECAYSDRAIGTVTPLSNNATLCSVPNFCEENTLPEGMNVDQAAAIVEACSLKKYPRITVANGFCMFIKREVINTIGNFDAETFGRGYGEENDFCNRAEQMGYIHVMCDDTYIYHYGTKSFVSKEKEAYIKEHDRILYKRYPGQMHKNALHCQENPNGWVGKNTAFHFDIWNGKKNILYLLQSDFREGADDNVGGTQLHVKHLTMGLCKDMNVFVAARDKDYLQVTAYANDKEYVFRFHIGEKEQFPLLHSRQLAEIFRRILEGFRIDIVHVHHTATTSLDIYYEADKLGIPIVFTAHDFYYVCPNEKLLDYEGDVCIGKNGINCAKCLKQKKGICEKNNYLSMWRKAHGEVLGMCRIIITPSDSAKDIFIRYYSTYKDKIKVIEHGMDVVATLDIDNKQIIKTNEIDYRIESINTKRRMPFIIGAAYFINMPDIQCKVILKVTDDKGTCRFIPTNFGNNADSLLSVNRFFAYLPTDIFKDGKLTIVPILFKDGKYYQKNDKGYTTHKIIFSNSETFRVAFIGGINEEKGAKIISKIIKSNSSNVEWFIMGGIGDTELYNLNQKNLTKMGFYHSDDIPFFLKYHKIDAVCILSKWPETFSYTLSEAINNGIPVIVTDIGALGQRVEENGYGQTVPFSEIEAVKETLFTINQWKNKGETYTVIKNKAEKYKHETIESMLYKYERIYKSNQIKNLYKMVNSDINKFIYRAYTGGDSIEDLQESKRKISMLEGKLKSIENNVTIRIMLRLTQKQFPFKKQMKRYLLKHTKEI